MVRKGVFGKKGDVEKAKLELKKGGYIANSRKRFLELAI